MRVLFTSTAGAGHIYPLMPLARTVRQAGGHALFAVPATALDMVRRLGFSAVATSSGEVTAETVAVFEQVHRQPDPESFVVAQHFGAALVKVALAPTIAAIAADRPDLVVSEFYDFSGPLAGRLHQHRGRLGLSPAVDHTWLYRHLFATAFPAFLETPGAVSPDPTLRFRHEDPEGVLPTGPRWASGRRPAVYATLGTMAPSQEGMLQTYRDVLGGLGNCDADVLFTIGALDPDLLGPIPDNVQLAAFVPQWQAMACDLVVSHAGTGTTLAALSRGLPMVAVPLFADQPHNADRLTALGCGVTLAADSARTALPEAVTRTLDDPSYAETARLLAGAMAIVPPAQKLLLALRALVDDRTDTRSAAS